MIHDHPDEGWEDKRDAAIGQFVGLLSSIHKPKCRYTAHPGLDAAATLGFTNTSLVTNYGPYDSSAETAILLRWTTQEKNRTRRADALPLAKFNAHQIALSKDAEATAEDDAS